MNKHSSLLLFHVFYFIVLFSYFFNGWPDGTWVEASPWGHDTCLSLQPLYMLISFTFFCFCFAYIHPTSLGERGSVGLEALP